VRFLRNGEPPFFVVVCFHMHMTNDPQDNVDVTADDELSDDVLKSVSGGGNGDYYGDVGGFC
jgi:hypothetical protein